MSQPVGHRIEDELSPRQSAREGSARSQMAYCSIPAVTVFLCAAIVALAADLASKEYVFGALSDAPGCARTLIPDVLRFQLSTNPGIVFGLRVPPWSVMVATAAAVIMVIAIFATSWRRLWGLHVALGMVIGGALGNAYDRLFCTVMVDGRLHVGEVRDFIDFYTISYPVFNLADVFLVVGVLLIMLHMTRSRPAGGRKQQTPGTKPQTNGKKQTTN